MVKWGIRFRRWLLTSERFEERVLKSALDSAILKGIEFPGV